MWFSRRPFPLVLRLHGLEYALHVGAVSGRYSVRHRREIKMYLAFRQLRLALGFLICATLAWTDSPGGVPVPEGLRGKVYFLTKSNVLLPDFSRLESVMTIYTNPIQVVSNYDRGFPGIPKRVGWFAIDYTGKIYIRTPGDYRFTLVSDDGGKFYIDDEVVVNNDHGLGDWTGDKRIHLNGGMHRIRLSYLQGPQGHHCITLRLNVEFPGSNKSRVFDVRDFYPPSDPSEWKYGGPADFDDPPDPDVGRIRLKDISGALEGSSVQNLIVFVRSEMRQHTRDNALAKSLAKLNLSERLESVVIEELQGEGLGPEALDALERLRILSAGKPSAPTLLVKFPPRPSLAEQTQFFRQLSRNAMNYTATLPNFICTEMVHRFVAPFKVNERPVWKPKDVLTVQLTYFGNHEKYNLVEINGRNTDRGYDSTGGAISEGDFGTQLLEIFHSDSETKFQWDHWTRLRGKLTQVYSYVTPLEHSHAHLAARGATAPPPLRELRTRDDAQRYTTTVGRHGFVYADNETQMVVRVTGDSDNIPAWFPVKGQSNVLDYAIAEIGGRQYLVPLRCEQFMRSSDMQFRNIEEFEKYRKFTGDSSISFDDSK